MKKSLEIKKEYKARDLARGKISEAITASRDNPVLIIKNSKRTSVIIDYDLYLKLTEDKKNEK